MADDAASATVEQPTEEVGGGGGGGGGAADGGDDAGAAAAVPARQDPTITAEETALMTEVLAQVHGSNIHQMPTLPFGVSAVRCRLSVHTTQLHAQLLFSFCHGTLAIIS